MSKVGGVKAGITQRFEDMKENKLVHKKIIPTGISTPVPCLVQTWEPVGLSRRFLGSPSHMLWEALRQQTTGRHTHTHSLIWDIFAAKVLWGRRTTKNLHTNIFIDNIILAFDFHGLS